jgi:hypothetical protein
MTMPHFATERDSAMSETRVFSTQSFEATNGTMRRHFLHNFARIFRCDKMTAVNFISVDENVICTIKCKFCYSIFRNQIVVTPLAKDIKDLR